MKSSLNNEHDVRPYSKTVWDVGKAMLKGEFIAVNVYIKTEDSQINVIFHIKTTDEKEPSNQKHARGV